MAIASHLKARPITVLFGLMLVGMVGLVDALSGYELSLSLFYLVPVSFVTWFAGKRWGLLIAFVCAIVWFSADSFAGHSYSNAAIQYWNASIRFGFFLTTTLLLSSLRTAIDNERELARNDNLTGAVNKRFFNDLLQREIERSRRYGHPFTLAYVDLDNFKSVNDSQGHSEGDRLLSVMVGRAKHQLRASDFVGRLGGDEFAFLLPETSQAEAEACISKLRHDLLEEMRRNNWPVTFSFGVLTGVASSQTTDALIKQADQLMYAVKKSGKNSIRYAVFAD